jgi:REP element-mobilizing transposase RayT
MHRGNEKRLIFRDDTDRRVFLESLGLAVERFGWILLAYALMPNHFHLFIKLVEETLSDGMHWLGTKYTCYFNARHQRVGHFFQDRFKSPLVEDGYYSTELLRYIALNPVRARLAKRPDLYKWSSHPAMIGDVHAPAWLAVDDALMAFAPYEDAARGLYRNFVDEGIGLESPLEGLLDEPYIGSETWKKSLREKVELKPRADAHPLTARRVGRSSINDILTVVAKTLDTDIDRIRETRVVGHGRMMAAWLGAHEGLLTSTEIAAGLRVRSASTVAKLLRSCEQELTNNPYLRAKIDECVSTLRSNEGPNGALTPTRAGSSRRTASCRLRS